MAFTRLQDQVLENHIYECGIAKGRFEPREKNKWHLWLIKNKGCRFKIVILVFPNACEPNKKCFFLLEQTTNNIFLMVKTYDSDQRYLSFFPKYMWFTSKNRFIVKQIYAPKKCFWWPNHKILTNQTRALTNQTGLLWNKYMRQKVFLVTKSR